MLKSQEVRKHAPEMDPLRMGMGWTVEDLNKPQIFVESTYGDSHPGSAHLNRFVEEAVKAVCEHGGRASRYYATDMCDGIAQGHDGINYSLPHREAIVNLVEAQANASASDGGVRVVWLTDAPKHLLRVSGFNPIGVPYKQEWKISSLSTLPF